jgi:hypothetical protein
MIQSYAWDLNVDGVFDIPNDRTPDVTAFFSAKPAGSYLIRLKVTDTTSLSFPGMADLSDTATSQVNVLARTDPRCAGCTTLTGRAAGRQVQFTWTNVLASGYALYRSQVSGGPYIRIAQVPGTQFMFIDSGTAVGETYYWVVRPLAPSTEELCQSNQVSFKIVGR